MCETFNTDRVLIWRLIIEKYGPYVEYTKVQKNIFADRLSKIPSYGNEETTQKSTFQQEIVSEINDTKEISEGTFPINLN